MDEIRVFVLPPHLKMIDHGVKSGDRASHLTSVQFAMAVAALFANVTSEVGQSPVGLLPPLRDFMSKIKVEADEGLLADYPRVWPARVRVTAGTTQHERLVTHVPGDPARPFDRARVRAKFLDFVGPVLNADKAEHILQHCISALASGALSVTCSQDRGRLRLTGSDLHSGQKRLGVSFFMSGSSGSSCSST